MWRITAVESKSGLKSLFCDLNQTQSLQLSLILKVFYFILIVCDELKEIADKDTEEIVAFLSQSQCTKWV